jgi:predicted GTPase
MLEAPNRDAKYDEWLSKGVSSVKKHIFEKNDDHLILIVGATGTGKSNLALHMFDEYMGDKADIDYVGLNPSSIATAIKAAKEKAMQEANDKANKYGNRATRRAREKQARRKK